MKSLILSIALLSIAGISAVSAAPTDVPQFLIITTIGMGPNAPVGSVQVTTLTLPSADTCKTGAGLINQAAPNLQMRAICVPQK
jgi:hypothetical protein